MSTKEKAKETASKLYEKGKEQLDKIPPNPVTKTIIGTSKRVWSGACNNPADTTVAVCVGLITWDLDSIADAVDPTDI